MTSRAWLLALGIKFLRFIHVVTCTSALLLFMADTIPLYAHTQFVYSFIHPWPFGFIHLCFCNNNKTAVKTFKRKENHKLITLNLATLSFFWVPFYLFLMCAGLIFSRF